MVSSRSVVVREDDAAAEVARGVMGRADGRADMMVPLNLKGGRRRTGHERPKRLGFFDDYDNVSCSPVDGAMAVMGKAKLV